MRKAIFCWSGGKDSSLALHTILKQGQYNIVCLLTTLNAEFKRVSMHGVREALLDAQAKSIGLPLEKVWVGMNGSNEEYENQMEKMLLKYKETGVEYVVFGDIFLEDLKLYRENKLAKVGVKAVFPLWKRDTAELIQEFLSTGFQTVICCTNNDYFDDSFVGRIIDESLIKQFPVNVDVCGENGEFHTFTFKGPIFKEEIAVSVGEKVLKTYEAKCLKEGKEEVEIKGFWFADLELK